MNMKWLFESKKFEKFEENWYSDWLVNVFFKIEEDPKQSFIIDSIIVIVTDCDFSFII